MKNIALLNFKALMDSFLNQGPRPLSSFSFISVFAWGDFFDFEFKIINDCLCVFAKGDSGQFLYLPPLGKSFNESTVNQAFEHMAQGGAFKPVHRIENIPSNLLSAFNRVKYNEYAKPLEYVYRKEDLIALKGNAYKSQRHDCHCFVNRNRKFTFEPYKDIDFDACKALYQRWSNERAQGHRDEIYLSMLEENQQVHARLLKYWQSLGLVVRVLKVEGIITGYTFGFVLDESTFCIYAEVADLKITGAAAYMFRSFCADEQLKRFSRINTMDDFAMPNVARAKKAYHPSELISSHTLSLKTERHS